MKMNETQLKEFVIKTLNENQIHSLSSKNDEKVTSHLITQEIERIKTKEQGKEKHHDNPGIKGLTKSDLGLLKRLNLAKTLARKRIENKTK